MKYILAFAVAIAAISVPMQTFPMDDPSRINVYVTPYYNSTGPVVSVGKYSAGLASKNEAQVVATIQSMRKHWSELSFIEVYVGAIRLYDFGYRNEATYWFYSAQYRGRLFGTLLDQDKMGSMGDPGFELFHAQDAFFQLAGPYINGYAFGNIDSLVAILHKVQSENATVPDMRAIYPHVVFKNSNEWAKDNATIGTGLGTMIASLPGQKNDIAQQRAQNGTAARYSALTSKRFPGGF